MGEKDKNKTEIIYKDLSFEIIGALFDVYNELGPRHPERIYCNAVEQALKNKGLKFNQQLYCKIEYEGKRVGLYYPDFVVENKMVLELKVRPRFSKQDFAQVKKYLKVENLKLGILATFCSDGVKFSRVVNLY